MNCFTYEVLCILNADSSLRILSTCASDVSSQMWPSLQWQKLVFEGNLVKSYQKFTELNLFLIHLILFWIDERVHFYYINMSSINAEFLLWYENCRRHFQMYLKCLKFVHKGPIGYKSALEQVMAWRRTGDKPLPEPMLTQFTDAYRQH